MVQSPFVWGRGGAKLTPEEIARQREIEDKLVQQGVDTSPVGHWTQGLARVANAMAGAFRRGQLDDAANENAAYNAAQTKSWFGGSDFPAAPSASSAALPAPAAQSEMTASNPAPAAGNGDYFSAIRAAESGGNDAARNPTSSAAGRYQFIDSTWNGLMRKYPELGLTADGRMDPQQQEKAIRAFTRDNAQALAGAGIDATPGNLYAAHFLGAGGARSVLSGDDASPVSAYVDPGVIKANPFLRNMTVGDFRNWSSRKGGGGTAPVDFGVGEVASAGPMTAYRDPMVSQSPAAAAIETQTPPQQAAMAPPLPPPVDVATPPAQPVNEAQMLAQAIRARGGNPNAGILPVITGEPGQTGMATTGPNMQALMGAMADPRLTEGNKRIAEILIRQQMEQQQAAREAAAKQAERQALWNREDARNKVLDDRYASEQTYKHGQDERDYGMKREEFDFKKGEAAQTGDIKEFNFSKDNPDFAAYQERMKRAGASSVNVGGGSDKQVFDEMKASADAARSAATGLSALREARKAVEGGAILGAGADTKLGLQKLAVGLGLANPEAVQNTETFRAAIAPQIASLMKATVGSTQISNADRDFAEKAAGGSITLEKGTILRLLDIMERAGNIVVQSHASRLNKVYPEGANFDRERALFGVDIPAPPTAPPTQLGKRLRFNPTTGDFE